MQEVRQKIMQAGRNTDMQKFSLKYRQAELETGRQGQR